MGAGVHGLSTAWHLAKESKAREPSGGIGCFTPDRFPVFDSYKMIGVGALVEKELMDEPQELLEPFRFSRYKTGELHPTSNPPFPWS
jgi:methylglutamate dehydrogenase subunit A